MATVTFETLQFRKEKEHVKVIFLNTFFCPIPDTDLLAIGKFHLKGNGIDFPEVTEKKLQHKFSILLEKAFQHLTSIVSGKRTVYIHKNSGIPLLGTRFIGIQDRGTTFLEIKPITGCIMGCSFCSVDEGIGSKKSCDFFVEREYLIEETKKLLEFKKNNDIHIYINPHGEPLLYPEITELIKDLKAIQWVKTITIITTGAMLTQKKIDELADAGLDELNISLHAIDAELAKKLMGNPAYNVKHVLDMIQYAAKKMKVTLAPVLIPGINDAEMEKIIAFAKKMPVRIQKFCYNALGRNPVKEESWDDFFTKLKQLEHKANVKLQGDIETCNFEKTKEYAVPFTRKEIVTAEIKCRGRYSYERLAVCKNRIITIPRCKQDSGKIKIQITHSSHNVIIGECM
jgi:uncharacterized Fe-S cluster-containing radical SAM superfamily enzyme